jgi:cytoskeletal protein RodZ
MNQFDPRSAGERLRAAREARNISLADASKATSIKFNHLQELEDDHPEVFNSAVQARGFLRLYAAFLNLDANDLIILWDKLVNADSPEKPVTQKESAQPNIPIPSDSSEHLINKIENADGQDGSAAELEEKSAKKNEPDILSPLTDKIKALFSRIKVPEQLKNIASKVRFPVILSKPKVAELTTPQETSQELFKQIGTALRDRRQVMDLNLSDIEHFTNLKRMVLVAIEDGRFNDLPSTVQGRGMLNNYAKFLAMDDSAVMDLYARALQLQREERMPSRKAPEPAVSVKVNLPEGLRRILNPDLIIGGALILALFGFIFWGASQMLSSSGGKPTEAPSISQMLQLTPSVSPAPDQAQTVEATQLAEQAAAVPGVVIAQSRPHRWQPLIPHHCSSILSPTTGHICV